MKISVVAFFGREEEDIARSDVTNDRTEERYRPGEGIIVFASSTRVGLYAS